MKNYENPPIPIAPDSYWDGIYWKRIQLTNNLTALYFFAIAKAIPKKICLAS